MNAEGRLRRAVWSNDSSIIELAARKLRAMSDKNFDFLPLIFTGPIASTKSAPVPDFPMPHRNDVLVFFEAELPKSPKVPVGNAGPDVVVSFHHLGFVALNQG